MIGEEGARALVKRPTLAADVMTAAVFVSNGLTAFQPIC
jgi:hypothetical protein